mgnify:CR=1 FL=1
MINQINVGVIGTGWCGGIRANACHDNPLVNKLFLAETNTKRLNELKNSLGIEGATENWKELINNELKFKVDSFKKKCLLEGLDDIALSLKKSDKIEIFEKDLKVKKPWVFND